MSQIPVYQVDAFAVEKYRGNPAAVCLLEDWLSDEEMQSIAAEMNLAETAFLRPRTEGEYDLRWMTPAVEVDLCGHATLASAHVLWTEGHSQSSPLRFHTRSGWLQAEMRDERIELDFPAVAAVEAEPPKGMCEALEIPADAGVDFVGRNEADWLIVLDKPEYVLGLSPDFRRLAEIECRGVIVSAPAADGADYDFLSRFFAPGAGIDEDPVTGSAHCCSAPYWSRRFERPVLTGYQASPRGGYVETEVSGDRVKLRGRAITVLRGALV